MNFDPNLAKNIIYYVSSVTDGERSKNIVEKEAIQEFYAVEILE
ncbi:MAG TPA: hypothetical protein VGC17_02450 [Lactovum miscens]